MADRGDTHYRVRGLNAWFAASSVLLLVSTVWMVLDDWNRSWKHYQREFREIEVARTREQAEALEAKGALQSEEQLRNAVTEATAAIEGHRTELAKAEEVLRQAKGERWRIVEGAKKAKSEFNFKRFQIENVRAKEGDESLRSDELAEAEQKMVDASAAQERAELAEAEAAKHTAELTARLTEAQSALSAGTRDLEQVRKKLATIDWKAMPADVKIVSLVRDAPGLDFVGPQLKVSKVVLDNLTFELNFTKKKRIDMCHTCHQAVDRAGYEGEEQPFASHPRLDLYLTAKSPHPLKDVGCTICHRGSGEALDFIRADHRPNDEHQEEEWAQEHHWHKQHHWDYPMLASQFVEASCVQCHKTSMELIANDAPRVSEGYQLVERYGCYACHKIDWFPTNRRPGPTLVNLAAKVTPEFVSSWVADPKAFRPSTWMPQFFHLENYAPAEGVTKSQHGAGREILGQEWNDAAVAAITAFLFERAPLKELPKIPVEGNAERGREVFRLTGCLACHNVAPWSENAPDVNDLALERRGTNEHGPNLRGVATKVTREWLYSWVKDPKKYWPDTRMPDLRLSDQDAADVTAYVMDDPDGYFSDVPEGWKPALVSMPEAQMREVLAEQARWLFARDGRSVVEARLEGKDPARPWHDTEKLKVAVGEKLVGQYGCFSCHEIEGMQSMMPIGTELSNWGSKTVDKLDFGFAYKKALAGRPQLEHEYREGWLLRKLHAPRSFDGEKVKNPIEKLRMPFFAFSDEQAEAIATFVVGLVDDEVQRAKMIPKPEQVAMDTGLRVVRQKNCLACHQVDPGTITFEGEDGHEHTVVAELLPFEDELVPPAHDLAELKQDFEDLGAEELGMRLLRPEPDLAAKFGERLFVPADKVRALSAPRGGDFVRVVTDYYYYGQELFDPEAKTEDEAYYSVTADPDGNGAVEDVDGKFRAFSEEPYDKVRWTYAPPVLWDEGNKIQRQWFFEFLKDVVPLRHQIRVHMPSFNFAPGEAESVADLFAHKAVREWPARFARELRLAQGKGIDDLAAASKVDARALVGIENGNRADTRANLDKLLAFATAQGFTRTPPVDPAYEATQTRGHAYLARRSEELPGHFAMAERIVTEAVNCYQCHFRLGTQPAADPLAWAPDLALAHERLREEWVLDWLRDPQSIYPGTSMPANFASETPQYQAIYPDSTNDDQLRLVLEWLFNFDRVYMATEN